MASVKTTADRHVPKRQKARRGYAEETNAASALLREETADVQRETPDRGNVAIERIERENPATPAFEE